MILLFFVRLKHNLLEFMMLEGGSFEKNIFLVTSVLVSSVGFKSTVH